MLWEFHNDQLLTTFSLICCFSYIAGWVTDRVIGYGGFSVIGNWLILLIGAYIGLFSYNLLGYRIQWDSHFTIMLTMGAAAAMLLTMLSIKTALRIR